MAYLYEYATLNQLTMNPTIESALSTLGLPTFASEGDIKAQYRRLALTHHPDKVHGGAAVKKAAHDQFARISAAYEWLTTCSTRNGVADDNRVLYASNFTDPYQLFQQSFGHASLSKPIVIPQFALVSGLLKDTPMEEDDDIPDLTIPTEEPAKRSYHDVMAHAPSSPTTTVIHDYEEPPSKRIKTDQAPPPPFLIRRSIKRDSWAIDPPSHDFVSTKRMRRTVCT